ncbi:hypothetical protein F5878DRAFT_366471 [Lentinula raphanica]|uniref:Uncharacterized protein n=1 Tax=Lentinula raphanica TaxID=153919 RepID=A0AA38UL84_9AGAR|nr:hypothetical protein F5878DRAFT_366471 [Lentinula raphanica]
MRSSSKLQLRFMTMKSDLAKLHTEHEDTVAELEAACMDLHAVLGLFRSEDVTTLPPSQPETPSPQVTEPAPDLVSQSLDDTSTESSFSDIPADKEEPHECTPRFETRSTGHVITAPDLLGLNEETYSFVHADSMLESSIGTARMLSPHAPARAVVDLNVEPALSTRDGPAILPNGDTLPSLSTPVIGNSVAQSSDATASTATQPNGSAFVLDSFASASLPATETVSTAFPTMTSARADVGSSFAPAQEPSFASPTIKESSGVTNEPTARFQSSDTSTTPSQSIGPSIISRTYSAPTPSASSTLNSIPTETLTPHISTPYVTSPQSLDSTTASQVTSSMSVATLVPQSTSAVGSSSSKTSAVSTVTVTPVLESDAVVAPDFNGVVVSPAPEAVSSASRSTGAPAPASTDSVPAKSSRKTSNATPAPVVTKPAPTSTQSVNTVSSSSSKASNAATAPVVTKPTSSSNQPVNTISSSLSSRTSNATTAPAVTKPTPTSTQPANTVPSSSKTSNGASAPVVKKLTPASKPANDVPSNAVASISASSAAPAALSSQGPNLARMSLSVTTSQPICTKLPSDDIRKIAKKLCLQAIGRPQTVNYHILRNPDVLFANSPSKDHTLINVSRNTSDKSSDLIKFSNNWRGHLIVQDSIAKHLFYLGEYQSGASYRINHDEFKLLPQKTQALLFGYAKGLKAHIQSLDQLRLSMNNADGIYIAKTMFHFTGYNSTIAVALRQEAHQRGFV